MKKKYLFFIVPLLVIIVIVCGGYYYINTKIYSPLPKITNENAIKEKDMNISQEHGIINILFVGVDARENYEDSRTDSMILVTLDTNNKKIKLTSFMRDMYVPIPNHEDNRINASFFLGGPELLLKTINQDFNINIQKYVSVDFNAFQDIVEKLGGIDLEVKDHEVKEINKYIKQVNGQNATLLKGPGMQHLNGQQALSYCRIRKVGNGDYERTERQRKVLSLLIDKARNVNVFKIPDLVSTVLPYVKTNIQTTKLISIGYTAFKFGNTPIETLRIPANGMFDSTKVRGMAVLVPDIEKNSILLSRFIYLDGSAVASNIPAYMNNNFHESDKAIDKRGTKKKSVKIVLPKEKNNNQKESMKPESQNSESDIINIETEDTNQSIEEDANQTIEEDNSNNDELDQANSTDSDEGTENNNNTDDGSNTDNGETTPPPSN